MQDEVKKVVYIAIGAMLLAIVLGFVSVLLSIRTDIAEIRNSEIAANKQLEQYRKFNKYDSKTLIGDEVIECIRMYYDKDVSIIVNTRKNKINNRVVDASSVKVENGVVTDDPRQFNTTQYVLSLGKKYTPYNYFAVAVQAGESNAEILQNYFPTDKNYQAYLVYDSVDVSTALDNILTKYASATGTTKIEKLDNAASETIFRIAGSTITGIIIIDLDSI